MNAGPSSGGIRFVALLVLWLLAGCERSEAAPAAPVRLAFSVTSPTVADTAYEREYVGEIHAARYAEIRSRLRGIVESVSVDEGQLVKSGELMFTLGGRELHQELLKARAATKTAEAELRLLRLERDNTQLLFEKKVVSQAELALAESKLEALSARIEESKASEHRVEVDLGYTKLRAPFEGFVNRIPRKAGSLVSENELLTSLSDTSEVLVYFRVSEREYLEYGTGGSDARAKEVSLRLADGSLHPATGVIDAVESEVDRDTGNLAFRARFANPKRTLKHGSTGKIVMRAEVPGALLVPQRSTFEVQGRLFVYVVDTNSTTHAREIVPRLRVGDSFVVASGLRPEERFIAEGVQKIKDGMRVDALPPS